MKNKIKKKLKEDYIRITPERFKYVPINTFIKWLGDDLSEDYTSGASIAYIGKTKKKPSRYYWKLENNKFSYTLYWDKVDHIMMRKNVFYDMMEEKIAVVTTMILYMAKELDMSEDFKKLNQKLEFAIDKKKLSRVNSTYF